jgi:hypothetical protein
MNVAFAGRVTRAVGLLALAAALLVVALVLVCEVRSIVDDFTAGRKRAAISGQLYAADVYCRACAQVYRETGRVYRNRAEFEASGYFPYVRSVGLDRGLADVRIVESEDAPRGSVCWAVYYFANGLWNRCGKAEERSRGRRQDSALILRTMSAPPAVQEARVERIRALLRDGIRDTASWGRAISGFSTDKAWQSGLRRPVTRAEWAAYFRRLYGACALRDAWGDEVALVGSGRRLRLRSRGGVGAERGQIEVPLEAR